MRILSITIAVLLASAASAKAAEPLVSPEWLADRLDSEDLVVLDIRNPIDGGSGAAFRAGHIPGAVYSSYGEDGWRRPEGEVPGMLPPVADLEALIGGLGIDNDDHVVIVHGGVSSSDFGSAARVFWTFRQLGHAELSILDGGYRGWVADADRPVARGAAAIRPATYAADPRSDLLATAGDVEAVLATGGAALVDGRPAEQFAGAAKHPAATAAGHIPGALSFDQGQWFEPASGRLKDVDAVVASLPPELRAGNEPVVSYCNTGHWAATNWFMLSEVVGRDDVRLYDGSMTEWTADPSRPVATRADTGR